MFLHRSFVGFLVATRRFRTASDEDAALRSDHLGTSLSMSMNIDDFFSLKQSALGPTPERARIFSSGNTRLGPRTWIWWSNSSSLKPLTAMQARPGFSFKFLKQSVLDEPWGQSAKIDSI